MDMFGTDTRTNAELEASIYASNTRARVAARIFEVTGPTVSQLWNWAGRHNARMRQALILAMTGQKLPQSKCGVNACIETLCAGFGIDGTCAYDREDQAVRALWDEWERAGLVTENRPRKRDAELEAWRVERQIA